MLSNNIGFNLLLGAEISGGIIAVIAIATAIVGVAIGLIVYRFYARRAVGSVKLECEKLKEASQNEAKTFLKEAKVEAKEEQQRLRQELDRETREKKAELSRTEQRLSQREDQLVKRELAIDKKSDLVDEKKKQVEQKEAEVEKLEDEVKNAHSAMVAELEKVSGMTQAEAKDVLIQEMLDEARKDAEVKVREIEQQAKEDADKKARNIVGMALQRCAVDHASEIAVSVVSLPNEDMKGRLIGRVGRNIRSIENCTGVDLIIDDTPDVVTISDSIP